MGEDITQWVRAVSGGLKSGTLSTARVAGSDIPRPVREIAERWYPIDPASVTTVRRGAHEGRVFYVVGDELLYGVYDDAGRPLPLLRRATAEQAQVH